MSQKQFPTNYLCPQNCQFGSIFSQKMAVEYSTTSNKVSLQSKQPIQNKSGFGDEKKKNQNRLQWTTEQQNLLFNLHDELGNKWAVIAQQLPGRNDNSIKNHFYSKLRKSLRKLNKIIHSHFRKQYKQIKSIVLYKIIQATEEKHQQQPSCSHQTSELCIKLKNRLLEYSYDQKQINDYEKNPQLANQLIRDLINFSRQYKRKTKTPRKGSVHEQDLLSPTRCSKDNKMPSENSESDASSLFFSQLSIFSSELSSKPEYNCKLSENIVTRKRAKSKQDILPKKSYSMEVQQEKGQSKPNNVDQFLRQSGILDEYYKDPIPELVKKSNSQHSVHSQGHLENEDQDFRFFEQSDMQMRIFPAREEKEEINNIFDFEILE